MKIALIRVDERLVHGQITMGWARAVGADLILAVNDEIASDEFQIKLMKMAAPVGAHVEVCSVQDAIQHIQNQTWPNASILLLVRNPIDLLRLIEGGIRVNKVNIGGVRSPSAKIKLTKEVIATPEELEAWKKLDQMGINLEVQWLPGSGSTNLNEIVRKHKS